MNKHIILGITGGISAYKSADLASKLKQSGAEVIVVMTESATRFISPLTFQAVTGNPVHTDLFDLQMENAMGHIELARWVDLILIAPATADFIAQLTHGHADSLLATLCLASKAPIWLAPAMNQQMWHAPATQDNINKLSERDIQILGPGEGVQACGDTGLGRMLEPDEIMQNLSNFFGPPFLKGIRVLITAGPTQEALDPVRYISNHSSGKMGYALAQAAQQAGADVTLVSGPVNLDPPQGVQCICVVTAQDMYEKVMALTPKTDIYIGAAAVADYHSAAPTKQKLPKARDHLELKLVPNPDILASVAPANPRPFVVGFAAETENLLEHAREKLIRKRLDLIVANSVGTPDSGFHSDNNSCYVLSQQEEQFFPTMPKAKLASELIEVIAQKYQANRNEVIPKNGGTSQVK